MQFIAYVRVKKSKNAEAARNAERDVIRRYAERHKLTISTWLEDSVSKKKRGFAFGDAIRMAEAKETQGIILGSLARRPAEWDILCRLVEKGAEIHFAREGFQMRVEGDALTNHHAALVRQREGASESVRRGIKSELEKGRYPFRPPIGYLSQGKHALKIIDPLVGPLITRAFEEFSIGDKSLDLLAAEMFKAGLRDHQGHRISPDGLEKILRNPYYTGIAHIRGHNRDYIGLHEPLVHRIIFERVLSILDRK